MNGRQRWVMNAKRCYKSGFTILEIMIVVSIIGLLAALLIPNVMRARARSQSAACINNLRQIDAAKQQWAMENRQPSTAEPQESDLNPYLGRTGSANGVLCPAGGADATFTSSYSINCVTSPPTCNIVPTGPNAHVLPQ
jgi:prepilin-type N-terminal cleavage/methylation domain-containing protein